MPWQGAHDLPQGIMDLWCSGSTSTATPSPTTGDHTTLTPEQLSWFIDNTVTKRLLAVPGVAQVSRSAASPGRSAWSSIRAGCRRSASRPTTSNEQLRRSISTRRRARAGRRRRSNPSACWRARAVRRPGGHPDHVRDRPDVPAARDRRRARRGGGGPKPRAPQRTPRHRVRHIQGKGASDVSVFHAAQTELDKIGAEMPACK